LLLKNVYCALVAVTTATDVGVATPSMGAGGGVLPAGGGTEADELLPPHPVLSTTIETSSIAMSRSRQRRVSVETFDMSATLRTGECPGSRCIGGEVRA
jgi:hypothetical protein